MTDPSSTVARLSAALADRYRVERELGAGGMATVYLAHDVRHDRKVALKVLRPELAAVIGAARFLAEIKTTANLQHPHILGLIDSGEVDGLLYYVMPFVEGESLRDRLTREKQLPVGDAVRIAVEVTQALDYAHRHHVIHRDIKPENILLHEGRALVADFGIALAAHTAGGTRMTETGMSLGTPHYMSPEQAMGERELDARSDMYALGATLYEMLTGAPPFTGPTAQAIVAKVLTADPERITTLRRTVPPHVEAAVHVALQKLPADRFATAGAFAAALEGTQAVSVPGVPARRTAVRRPTAWVAAGLVAAGVIAGSWLTRLMVRPAAPDGPPARFEIPAPGFQFLPLRNMALSADGASIVFFSAVGVGEQGGAGLRLRRLDRLVAAPITGGEGGINPVLSPDGREVLFSQFQSAYRVPIEGGQVSVVPDVPANAHIVWTDDGAIVFLGSDGALWRVAVAGGRAQRLVAPDSAAGERLLQVTDVLPGGRIALVKASAASGPVGPLYAIDLRSGRRTRLLDSDVRGAWYAGHETLIYVPLDGSLSGVAFDPAALTVSGEPVSLGGPVSAMPLGTSRVAVSRTGSVLYTPLQPADLVEVRRDGLMRTLLERRAEYHNPKVSPDGRRVALDINEPSGRDVWVLSLDQGTLTRVTFDNDGHDAVWSRDGRSLVYVSVRDGVAALVRSRLDGSPGEVIGRGATSLGGWAADGRLLAVSSGAEAAQGWNITALGPDGRLEPFLATRFSEAWPAMSPDGQWLAYVSDESRQLEVYLRRVDGGGERLQVSTDGGSEPVWSRDGRELFYRRTAGADVDMMAARLELGAAPRVISRQTLFAWGDLEGAEPHPNYDVTPDGRGFIMVRRSQSAHLVLIQNVHRLVHAERR